MASEAAFHSWLCAALSRVKLEDDAYVGYVESILKEDTYQPDEKKEAVLEFLASSTEEDLSDFGDELMVHWSKIDEAKKAEDEEKKREEAERLKAAQLQQQKEREEKAKQRSVEHQLSKDERLRRRELLERYGYQIETTDENGDIVLTENLCDVQDAAAAEVEQNDNVTKIVQESQAQREKAREKHQQKVHRDKENLLKEQEKKEKRKRKTEKREKRRL